LVVALSYLLAGSIPCMHTAAKEMEQSQRQYDQDVQLLSSGYWPLSGSGFGIGNFVKYKGCEGMLHIVTPIPWICFHTIKLRSKRPLLPYTVIYYAFVEPVASEQVRTLIRRHFHRNITKSKTKRNGARNEDRTINKWVRISIGRWLL